ncbi:MAG: prepilin-type N-terminal cleavage/methylation domain-containing protein [Chthoniobacterales bacterium]|nr:prepilin-type N-terminal cleavage/methylation domain-containing protein [Chthoniobacterales bacterium]
MRSVKGFTLVEMMVAIPLGFLILAAVLTSSVALNRSFAAVDNFFSTHLQQVRVIEYLCRDVKRSTIAEISADAKTIYCWIPRYIIRSGDSDATSSNLGTRRTPTVTKSGSGYKVDYYSTTTANGPSGTSTNNSAIVYAIRWQSIVRTEDGAITAIASSTDQLVDQVTDVQLANTGYLSTVVTFLPIFISTGAAVERAGTTVYGTAYLRNARRGN